MDEFPSIRDILSEDVSSWLVGQLGTFASISKFRACNSVQFLTWASNNEEAGMKIPALFCALHAEEEAIAAFVSVLKDTECGADAKAINLHCHRHKSVVRILCHQIMKLVAQKEIAVAISRDRSKLVMVKFMGAFCGEQVLDLSLIEFRTPSQKVAEDFYQLVLNDMGNTVEISKALKEWTNLRNDIFYASKNAPPVEPDNIDELLSLSAWVSLGLIWAVNAVTVDPKIGQVFASQFLKTARKIIDESSVQKSS